MSGKLAMQKSSGNVFADLELPQPEEHLAKAALAAKIADIIRRRRLSQKRAADLLGADQPKVSALMRGKLSGFSTGRLLKFLVALGHDVDIRVQPKSKSRRRARLKVTAA